MAAAARARAAPLHPGLPDEIFIWEVLVRLPPKTLLRCRAVCRGWRRATSTRDFLLAHHGRQPSLPLLQKRISTDDDGRYLEIMPLDHRAGVAAADQLQSVARLGTDGAFTKIEASCDGLLILCTREGDSCFSDVAYYSICNPATRQYAPLPLLLRGFCVAGMYPHPPTGEYRLLMYLDALLMHDEPDTVHDCYVYTLGSCQLPRNIGWPEAEEVIHACISSPLHFCGSLHWFVKKDDSGSGKIMVFDTTAELFRQMRSPAVPCTAELFEMDGMLGMASFNLAVTSIDIWMTQDYDREAWAFKCQVKLPAPELTVWHKFWKLAVSSWDDDDNDMLILVQSGAWLLQIDIGGKLIGRLHRESLGTPDFRLKQSLVPHTFFPTIEGYVVNTWPFISPDDYVENS